MLAKTPLGLLFLASAVSATFFPVMPKCWKKCARQSGLMCQWGDLPCLCKAANQGVMSKANSCACNTCEDREFGNDDKAKLDMKEFSFACKAARMPLDQAVYDTAYHSATCPGEALPKGPPAPPPPPSSPPAVVVPASYGPPAPPLGPPPFAVVPAPYGPPAPPSGPPPVVVVPAPYGPSLPSPPIVLPPPSPTLPAGGLSPSSSSLMPFTFQSASSGISSIPIALSTTSSLALPSTTLTSVNSPSKSMPTSSKLGPGQSSESSPSGYGSSPSGYGSSPSGYGSLPSGYGLPPSGYGSSPSGYGSSPNGYGSSPNGYGSSPSGYGSPPLPPYKSSLSSLSSSPSSSVATSKPVAIVPSAGGGPYDSTQVVQSTIVMTPVPVSTSRSSGSSVVVAATASGTKAGNSTKTSSAAVRQTGNTAARQDVQWGAPMFALVAALAYGVA